MLKRVLYLQPFMTQTIYSNIYDSEKMRVLQNFAYAFHAKFVK